MVVSLTPIIPATSAAANSSVSRVVPLPFSMPSHRFPLLAASAAAQCTGHVYLRLRLLANTLLYLTLIYFILPYCVQGNLAPRRTWRKKGVAYDHESHRQHRGAARPHGRDAKEHRDQVGLQDHRADRLRAGRPRRADRLGDRGQQLRGRSGVALRHLPYGRLHDQPRAGEGRLQGALQGLVERPEDPPRATTYEGRAIWGPGPRTSPKTIPPRREERRAPPFEPGNRELSGVVGEVAARATLGETRKNRGLPRSGTGRGPLRDGGAHQGCAPGRDLPHGRPLDDMGRGCLFWLLVSVLLSVTLTVVVNLVLFALSG